jgi:L-threonylcarbamoyladenylate synthase
VREVVRALGRGVVAAVATESFFGLLADVTSPAALDVLFSLKPRGSERGVGLLLPGREAWPSLVREIPEAARALADAFWPGPLTVALAAGEHVDPRLLVQGTLAVRDPGPGPAREVVLAFARPLTATSANLPGEPPAVRASEVERSFSSAIADGRLVVLPGESPGGAPSTLVAVEAERVRLVRRGAVSEDALLAVLGPLGHHLDGLPSPR